MGYQTRKGVVICALVATLAVSWAAGARDADAVWTQATIGNYQYWFWDGQDKFRYDTTVGQWGHYSDFGGWRTLSGTGLSSAFIGDGGVYSLKNGLNYSYNVTANNGFLFRYSKYRFYYNYTAGQWYTTGYGGGWFKLGNAALSTAVLADGAFHTLGNGLDFRYVWNFDQSAFLRDGAFRFKYEYGPGQWYSSGFGGGWYVLGAAGLTAANLADGVTRPLGNGFSYRYAVANDFGFFTRGSAYRFYYQHTPGQWFTSGFGGGWYVLGDAGLTAEMLGDGAVHDLGNGFGYRYLRTNDFSFFTLNGAYRFYYKHAPGQWYTSGFGGGWYVLGVAGLSASFMGDGAFLDHDLGNGFTYSYTVAGDSGVWRRFTVTNTTGFTYYYTNGLWTHTGRGNAFGYNPLGHAGMTASFIGDGSFYDLGNGYFYFYSYGEDYGWWYPTDAANPVYYYEYLSVSWYSRTGPNPFSRIAGPGVSTGAYNPGEP